MHYVFPALAILLANPDSMSQLDGGENAVEMWLEMVGLIAEKSGGARLRQAHSLCLSLRRGNSG